MNLQRLIEQYISLQQSLGASFTVDAAILRAFGRARGSRASVAGVRLRHVDSFLGKDRPVTRTWFRNFFGLRPFFQYAVSRGYITIAPLPTIMPKEPPAFDPYIYSRDEIRRLLLATESRAGNTRLEPVTIRTMILLYYGAGLRRREATNLTRSDVDLRQVGLDGPKHEVRQDAVGSRGTASEPGFGSIRRHATGETTDRRPLFRDPDGQ